jgi:hypothetical protein
MTFKTQDELVAFSTGVFIDNASGLITPSNFRDMHEHFADSMIPYDASGVFQVSTVPTGSVPTPTPTGAMVFDTSGPLLWIYTGGGTTGWGSISISNF